VKENDLFKNRLYQKLLNFRYIPTNSSYNNLSSIHWPFFIASKKEWLLGVPRNLLNYA